MPSGYKQDLTGQVFGRLTVLEKIKKNNKTYYKCICSCEDKTIKDIRADALTSGKTKSCGCLNRDVAKESARTRSITHGMSKSRLYRTWHHMISRCENINVPSYKDYGGRGIKLCDEWRKDFMKFYEWAIDNGFDENNNDISIDRIDVNGDYEPNNCRWVDQITQVNNRTITVFAEINGTVRCATDWDREYDFPIGTVAQRLRKGKQGEDLIKPIRKRLNKQSGHKNITWHQKSNKWRLAVSIDKKKVHIGYFDKLEDAIKAKYDYLNQDEVI